MTRGRLAIVLLVLAALGAPGCAAPTPVPDPAPAPAPAAPLRDEPVLREHEARLADPDPEIARDAALFLLHNGGRDRLLRRLGEPRVAEALDFALTTDADACGDMLGPLLRIAARMGSDFEPAMRSIERIGFALGPDAYIVHDRREVYYVWEPKPGGGHSFGAPFPNAGTDPVRRLHAWAAALVDLGLLAADEPARAALPPKPAAQAWALGVYGRDEVAGVLPGSPAERIGIQAGDRPVIFDSGIEMLGGGDALQERFRVLTDEGSRPEAIDVDRDGKRLTLPVRPEHFADRP